VIQKERGGEGGGVGKRLFKQEKKRNAYDKGVDLFPGNFE